MNVSSNFIAQARIRAAVRRSVLVATSSAILLGAGSAVLAASSDGDLEVVVVTGSRIARAETESSTPVQVINEKSILDAGSQNIADILKDLPAVGTAAFSKQNSNFNSFGNGLATINLRNLGDSRTLVLLNGRRVVSGLAGDSTVDINNIPTDLLESVEVLTGGASATYGSEAIAGVVNFKLKDDFEGLSFRGQVGQTTHGDNGRYMASITGGTKIFDSGHIVLNVTHDDDQGLRSKNREISAEDNPFRSSYSAQGVFYPGADTYTYDANNVLKLGRVNADGYNRNGDRYISVPLERTLITALGDAPITDNVSAFFEGSYSTYFTRARLEPVATDNSDARYADGSSYGGLTLDNPYIPQAIRADMIAQGETELPFRKRWVGIADRSNETDREFQRVVAGLKGSVFNDWNWEAYYLEGTSKDSTASGTGLRTRYLNAIDVISGPSGPMCRDPAARAEGCAPMNLFGFNSVSQASIDYVTVNGTQQDSYDSYAKQDEFAANITGAIMDLPAGSWRIAAGIEHRNEYARQVYNPETQAGNTLGNALTNTFGKYDVTEGYVETVVPLLKDLPLVRSLDLEGAYRYGDYSTVGGVDNWKAGISWAPIDSLRFRAVYSNATRAPNISELYGGQNQTFPAGIVDPCEGVSTTAAPSGISAAVAGYCRSLPGFTQNAALNGGVFTYNPNTDLQSITGYDGGNSNLGPETAKTWTVGLVLTPTALPNFQLTLDWYDIKIDDAIAVVPRQFIVDQCVNSLGVDASCSFLTREGAAPVRPRSPGTLYQIDSGPVNAASIKTSGLDLTSRYFYAFSNGQRLDLSLTYTYLDTLTLEPVKGEPIQDNVGQLNQYAGERLGSGFENRGTMSLGYTVGGFNATWRAIYQSAMVDTLDIAPTDPDYLHVGAYWYHDMQARYSWGSDTEYSVYAGVDNVFDKKPPVIDQNHASNFPGTETSADSYDAIGRFVYLGFQLKINP
ncbi:MAG: TonB-dependent receptor [Pseudomonadota bacterium]